MEVKPGYKLTEVGVIPDDWGIATLGTVASIIDPQPDHRTPPEVSGGEPYIGISDFINDTLVDWSNCRKIIPLALDKQQINFQICHGDIIFGKIGTIGSPKFLPVTLFRYALSANVILIKPKIESHFLMSWLKSSLVQKRINQELHSTSQAAFGILKMRELSIALPPLSEQRSIATVLSDMDALLRSLDQLIAKKRDLKQATMQQLLTGKKRLPGFEGDWKLKRLGDILTICHGRSQHEVEVRDGQYPILATGGKIGYANRYLYDKPSVLIGRKGTIDQPQYMDTPFWSVDTLFYSIIRDLNNAKFIFYRFCLIDWRQYNEASGVPSLNARTIESIEILCPKPEEQRAIATALSDMDTELAALEQRRDKTRALKQGMMQELLTGRTRLL